MTPQTPEQHEISVVIPCFNEEDNVRGICAEVTRIVETLVRSHEIILIDNCSTDRTRAIMRELCAGDPRIRAIFNTRNFGQMRSPTYGLYQADGMAVIGMGADFQDPPAMIGEFIRQWRAGAQVVMGQRRSEPASLLLRLARHWGYRLLGRISDQPIIPGATGFGLFDRKVIDTLAAWREPEPFFRAMVLESGFRLAIVPFDRPQRKAGESKNGFTSLTSFALSGLAGSARSLLRLPIMLSPLAGAVALLFAGSAAAAPLLGGDAWPLVAMAVAFGMFAVLLLFIGLIGDQVRLLAERSRNAQLVIEQERINFPPERGCPAARTALGRQ